MIRRRLFLVVLILLPFLTGCGDSGQKGINKDKDKPKPVQREP